MEGFSTGFFESLFVENTKRSGWRALRVFYLQCSLLKAYSSCLCSWRLLPIHYHVLLNLNQLRYLKLDWVCSSAEMGNLEARDNVLKDKISACTNYAIRRITCPDGNKFSNIDFFPQSNGLI